MALSRAKQKDLPPDAVILTEQEAFKYQINLFKNWNNPWDVSPSNDKVVFNNLPIVQKMKLKKRFAFKYGSYMLGAATLFSCAYFNNYFRWKFKVGHYGKFASYLPICVVPSVFAIVMHQELVLRNVMLTNEKTCPICLQTRASVIQTGLSGIAPVILAPLSSLSLASMYHTYNVPYISQEPKKVLELIIQKSKPLKNTVLVIFAIQFILANIVTYFEADSVFRVHNKLMLLEEAEDPETLKP